MICCFSGQVERGGDFPLCINAGFVVYDFKNQVVQAVYAGGADVHTGALADGLESFKDGDILCGIIVGVCHEFMIAENGGNF
jgi:hypothetical protein